MIFYERLAERLQLNEFFSSRPKAIVDLFLRFYDQPAKWDSTAQAKCMLAFMACHSISLIAPLVKEIFETVGSVLPGKPYINMDLLLAICTAVVFLPDEESSLTSDRADAATITLHLPDESQNFLEMTLLPHLCSNPTLHDNLSPLLLVAVSHAELIASIYAERATVLFHAVKYAYAMLLKPTVSACYREPILDGAVKLLSAIFKLQSPNQAAQRARPMLEALLAVAKLHSTQYKPSANLTLSQEAYSFPSHRYSKQLLTDMQDLARALKGVILRHDSSEYDETRRRSDFAAILRTVPESASLLGLSPSKLLNTGGSQGQ